MSGKPRHTDRRASDEPRLYTLELGAKLRAARERLGLERSQLASRVGVSVSYVQQLERGERNITVHFLCKFAHFLQVEPAAFMPALADLNRYAEAGDLAGRTSTVSRLAGGRVAAGKARK